MQSREIDATVWPQVPETSGRRHLSLFTTTRENQTTSPFLLIAIISVPGTTSTRTFCCCWSYEFGWPILAAPAATPTAPSRHQRQSDQPASSATISYPPGAGTISIWALEQRFGPGRSAAVAASTSESFTQSVPPSATPDDSNDRNRYGSFFTSIRCTFVR